MPGNGDGEDAEGGLAGIITDGDLRRFMKKRIL